MPVQPVLIEPSSDGDACIGRGDAPEGDSATNALDDREPTDVPEAARQGFGVTDSTTFMDSSVANFEWTYS